MSQIDLTYFSAEPPTEQPSRADVDSVVEALITAKKMKLGRGAGSLVEIRKDDQTIYDKDELLSAVSRLENLESKGLSERDAAMQIAKEDGHEE